MASVRCGHTFNRTTKALRRVATESARRLPRTVAVNAREGKDQARSLARVSAGSHGRLYPSTITAERLGPLTWVYGPDASKDQGGMSFERGSRNQPPHLDLARSADIIHIQFGDDVLDVVDGLFW